MDNVICLKTRRQEKIIESPKPSEADEYLSEFYDWCHRHGIDTSTTEFKFNAATVLTTVQSLLHSRG